MTTPVSHTATIKVTSDVADMQNSTSVWQTQIDLNLITPPGMNSKGIAKETDGLLEDIGFVPLDNMAGSEWLCDVANNALAESRMIIHAQLADGTEFIEHRVLLPNSSVTVLHVAVTVAPRDISAAVAAIL